MGDAIRNENEQDSTRENGNVPSSSERDLSAPAFVVLAVFVFDVAIIPARRPFPSSSTPLSPASVSGGARSEGIEYEAAQQGIAELTVFIERGFVHLSLTNITP